MKIGNFVSFRDVKLEDGFWQKKYDLNKNVSIFSVRDRFEETARFDAMRFNYLKTGKKPHIFYDSDVAKWVEGVAYIMEHDRESMKENEKLIDEMVDAMAEAQREDGYLNSYHQQIEPEKIFKIRNNHELYCCGHFIEAAIAYHHATGKRKLLDIMEKYVDCIIRAFVTEKTADFATPGHEEIELALYKLYRYTGEKKYADLAKHFLTRRGVAEEDRGYYDLKHSHATQDNADIYSLREAVGHSVRALYLYSAITDLLQEEGDVRLKSSLDSVWRDIVDGKMYITGGVGSTHRYEGFTLPYDLPNMGAYSESCCAIAFIMWAMRMRVVERNAEYGHVIERIAYNNLISPVSLDGKGFFYENPLEIAKEDYGREVACIPENREHLPIRQRVEVFHCSCCPPNINRWFAEMAEVACFDEDITYIEQYISCTANGKYGAIRIKENYAVDGKAEISSVNYTAGKIAVRIPEWCTTYTAVLNGKRVNGASEKGYAYFEVDEKFTLSLDFNIAPVFISANANVRANAGRVALCYGPLVYCLEGVDNGDRLNKISVNVDELSDAKIYPDFHGFNSIEMRGYRDEDNGKLYFNAKEKRAKEVTLKFIPYYAFANRGDTDMLVWVREK